MGGITLFEGKPIEKLIEVISQGIGTLYRPRAIRKEADAEAYKLVVLEKAKAKAAAEKSLVEFEMLGVMEQKILYREQKKQLNLEKIIEIAAEQINQDSQVNSEKVDFDWTTRFFNLAEDISNEQMQELWGKILSGEVKKPGSFSLRTLELLKNISKNEAEIFTKFVQLNVRHSRGHFIPYIDQNTFEEYFNISYSEILLMYEIGLLSSGPNIGLHFPALEFPSLMLYEFGTTGIQVTTAAHDRPNSVAILSLTQIGLELAALIRFERNEQNIKYLCKALTTPYTKIILGELVKEAGQVKLKNVFEYKP
ncbi:DUF2806 domain-containing protein [Flavobacterium panacagri]|uniref:DUF2806 domain-containing protein n=1 Tax=Flavobacterium panacagri TaxID=3034146 RepID=UPI0025A4ECB1|nr:DUF2806 domain-containing protein [Flavobacterium panacagri]